MRKMRYCRPVLCMLLAVSTAVGALPVKACACPSYHRLASETPAAPVCEITSPPACCANCTMHCCGEAAKSGPEIAPKSCECLTCDCQSAAPQPQDSTPPPAPVDSSSLEFASAPPAPPVLLTVPSAAFPRTGEAHSNPPPIDLTIALSRLTC